MAWLLVFDPEGNLYVGDTDSNRVRKFDRDRQFVTAWGRLGRDAGQFQHVGGIAIDGEGNISLPDYDHDHGWKLAPGGETLQTIGTPGSGLGQLLEANDAAADVVESSSRGVEESSRRRQVGEPASRQDGIPGLP